MKLVLAKLESKADDAIAIADEDVRIGIFQPNHSRVYVVRAHIININFLQMLQTPPIGMEKLLLHRIPIHVPSEALARVICGDFTIELKVDYVIFHLYTVHRYALPHFFW